MPRRPLGPAGSRLPCVAVPPESVPTLGSLTCYLCAAALLHQQSKAAAVPVQQTTELSFLQTSSKCLQSVRVYENIDDRSAGGVREGEGVRGRCRAATDRLAGRRSHRAACCRAAVAPRVRRQCAACCGSAALGASGDSALRVVEAQLSACRSLVHSCRCGLGCGRKEQQVGSDCGSGDLICWRAWQTS